MGSPPQTRGGGNSYGGDPMGSPPAELEIRSLFFRKSVCRCRGWHGRTVELEPALGGENGSCRAAVPLPPPRAGSSGRSGEVG